MDICQIGYDICEFDSLRGLGIDVIGRVHFDNRDRLCDGEPLEWIKSFLSCRKQRVVVNGVKSDWTDVTSGVPQGSVLGPILFVIFINDLPDVVDEDSILYMFADDTKLSREIMDAVDNQIIQDDIDGMDRWSIDWLMDFHPCKCKVVKMGKPRAELFDLFNPYTLRGHQLEVVDHEKDLGVIIDCELTFDLHIAEKVNKANMVLGIIRNSFLHLDKESFMCLYKAMVRPHLEYANQVWAPRYQRQIDALENVQRRATRLIPGLKHLSYEDRLKYLKLPTLTYRRLRGDLIEVYKIVTSKYDPDVCKNLIKLRQGSKTRGNSYKIFKEHCYKNLRKNSFPHRVIDTWNSLPEPVVKVNTVVSFESRLDKFFKSHDIVYDYRAKQILLTPEVSVKC